MSYLKQAIAFVFFIGTVSLSAQFNLKGTIKDATGEAISFADVVLYQAKSDQVAKVASSDDNGDFEMLNIDKGQYYIRVFFIGYDDYRMDAFELNSDMDLGLIELQNNAMDLETVIVKARRPIVEVKADRTVFNVEGTINSAGEDALELLRKAPGVMVDNNNNISVLSRSGVLIYVDGRRIPLAGEDLTAYLQNLPAEQIDKMDIITNPGAKYEAQGNAGIIDIRLKRNKDQGANGSFSSAASKGRYWQQNHNLNLNYKNQIISAFGTVGYKEGTRFHDMTWLNEQNGLIMDEINNFSNRSGGLNYRLGSDFYVAKHHTIGVLFTADQNTNDRLTENVIQIAKVGQSELVDSILVAGSTAAGTTSNKTYNLNYGFDNKKHSVNIDLDYGAYTNDISFNQPNQYYDAQTNKELSRSEVEYDTPVKIDIYTAKLDYETNVAGGKLGLGSKLSVVKTHNTYLFYNLIDNQRIQNDYLSNIFEYDEKVYAGYLSYNKSLSEKWSAQAGLRVEATDSRGDLQAFRPELQEDPVIQNYVNYFPSAGLRYSPSPVVVWSLNYGRRINRPNYRVLNPFRIQQSELSFRKGNPFLNPEIVNNLELGLTLFHRFNFKLSHSKTTGQITRLISPDKDDSRASFVSWDNLAVQNNYGFNISTPFSLAKWWNVFINASMAYLDNQADYGDGAVVDVQALSYNIFQQHTFKMPMGLTGEISGYYSGPGIWGGVFEYGPTWALNLGLQKKFFKDRINVKLSAKDLFLTSPWYGESNFNGLRGIGTGRWDSRRVGLSLSYNFGNNKIKTRKRKTGLEEEIKRTGGDD